MRGCNYACTYCPFAKQTDDAKALLEDESAFNRFVAELHGGAFRGSVLLAPYGEGMIHPHYQRGYAALSRIPGVAAISCQTNLSWDVDAFLRVMERQKANLSKLALWASFHPSMTEPEPFLRTCEALHRHIHLCVGAVGNPADLPLLRKLKQRLPPGVGFWVNAMDGLGRAYTSAEREALTELDPLFALECRRFPADGNCAGRFVDARGRVSRCNRSRASKALGLSEPLDSLDCRGICDCFLAYANRRDIPALLRLGPYPQLRLPGVAPRALFLDLDGCIAQGGQVENEHRDTLTALCRRYPVYLATARTEESALRLLRGQGALAGGVFACGAEVADYRQGRRQLFPLPLTPEGGRVQMAGDVAIKWIPAHRPEPLPAGCRRICGGRLAVVAAEASKQGGIKQICLWNGWQMEQTLAFGNGGEDVGLLESTPYAVAPPGAHAAALRAARYHMDFAALAAVLCEW